MVIAGTQGIASAGAALSGMASAVVGRRVWCRPCCIRALLYSQRSSERANYICISPRVSPPTSACDGRATSRLMSNPSTRRPATSRIHVRPQHASTILYHASRAAIPTVSHPTATNTTSTLTPHRPPSTSPPFLCHLEHQNFTVSISIIIIIIITERAQLVREGNGTGAPRTQPPQKGSHRPGWPSASPAFWSSVLVCLFVLGEGS